MSPPHIIIALGNIWDVHASVSDYVYAIMYRRVIGDTHTSETLYTVTTQHKWHFKSGVEQKTCFTKNNNVS